VIRVAGLAMLLLASGCTYPSGSSFRGSTLPSGQWGGEQIALEISADGHGHVTLSCGSADFAGPVKLDVGGHFLTAGTFARGTGVEMVQPPPPLPANISGRLDPGGVIWLDIATRDSYPVRGARLRRGPPSNLVRCL
jgi:hypothetical protein